MNLEERKPSSKIKQPHRLEFITCFFMLFVTSVPSPGTRALKYTGCQAWAGTRVSRLHVSSNIPTKGSTGCLFCPTSPLRNCQLLCLEPRGHQGDALLADDNPPHAQGHRGLEGLQSTEEMLTPPRGRLRPRGIMKRNTLSPGGTGKGATR